MDGDQGKPSGSFPASGLAAFASRDFRRYQLARVAVIMGAEAQTVAVAWQVYSITHRALDLGYTGLALFLPGLFFLLPAGHVADRALSHGHIGRIETQLREEVQQLMEMAGNADRESVPDGMDVPAEIARREARLKVLAEAKAKIEARAKERFEQEQQEYEAKVARREAQRKDGRKPRGKEPKPPQGGARERDQINLTDEESRIMPASSGGFEQGYNAQAAVDVESMLIVGTTVTQQCNDKRQIAPMVDVLGALPGQLGQPDVLLADAGYFSEANVTTCEAAELTPLIAIQRDAHHRPLMERFADDPAPPESTDPLIRMTHQLKTKAGRALYGLRKNTVEPVFGIIKHVMGFRQFSLRGLSSVAAEWSLVALAWNIKRMNVLRGA